MESLCYACEKEIDDDDENFAECDSCNSLFHIKCVNITKKELNARKNSKCLRLYCPECFNQKGSGTADKLNQILKVLYKLDLFNQEQKVMPTSNKNLSSIETKLNELTNKFSTNCQPTNTSNANKRNSTHTYAETTKHGIVKPAVVIKPKTKQTSAKTLDELTKNVDKSSLNVCDTRNVRNGGIVLRCESTTETMKVKQIVNEKLGENYEVLLPKIKKPRVRISNVDADIAKDSVIDELKKHNSCIEHVEMELITVIPRKVRSNSFNDIVVELNSENYKTLLDIGVLNLPWRECPIHEHTHVIRCYKFTSPTNVNKLKNVADAQGHTNTQIVKRKPTHYAVLIVKVPTINST